MTRVRHDVRQPTDPIDITIEIRSGDFIGMRTRTMAVKDDTILQMTQMRNSDGFQHINITEIEIRVLCHGHIAENGLWFQLIEHRVLNEHFAVVQRSAFIDDAKQRNRSQYAAIRSEQKNGSWEISTRRRRTSISVDKRQGKTHFTRRSSVRDRKIEHYPTEWSLRDIWARPSSNKDEIRFANE